MKFDFLTLKDNYTQLLSTVQVKDEWKAVAVKDAAKITAGRVRYQTVSDKTGVPWYVIGLMHLMESGCDFQTYLGNGQSLSKKTTIAPAGRGPFKSFEAGAVDAITVQKLDKVTDWSNEYICFVLESYNGFGYRYHSVNSPYLWSGTNLYTAGKFTTDGNYDSSAVSEQIGAIPVLFELQGTPIMTTAQLKDSSRKLTAIDKTKKVLTASGTVITGIFTLDSFHTGIDIITQVKQFVEGHAAWFLLGGIGVTYGVIKIVEELTKQDYADGRYTPSGTVTQPAPATGGTDANVANPNG